MMFSITASKLHYVFNFFQTRHIIYVDILMLKRVSSQCQAHYLLYRIHLSRNSLRIINSLCDVLVSLHVEEAGLGGGGMSSLSAMSLPLSLELLFEDDAFTDDTVSGD